MRNVHAGLTWVALACCLIACGDDSEDSGAERDGTRTCEPFVACGGDITGTWMVKDFCSDDLAGALGMVIDQPQCRDAARVQMLSVSGDYTFAADGTASYARTMHVELQFTWTPSCLTAINEGKPVNVPATCSKLDDTYGNDPKYESGSCQFDGTSCDCSVIRRIERTATTTYQVSGAKILTSGAEPGEFCVAGDTLKMLERADAAEAVITFTR